jgi:poly(3-hydroxybutyrate) depolymerase
MNIQLLRAKSRESAPARAKNRPIDGYAAIRQGMHIRLNAVSIPDTIPTMTKLMLNFLPFFLAISRSGRRGYINIARSINKNSMDGRLMLAIALTVVLLFGCTGQNNEKNNTAVNNAPKTNAENMTNGAANVTPAVAPAEGTITERTVPENANWRYVIYLPPNYNRSMSYPAVIGLHGSGGSAMDYANVWKSEADKNGFMFAFPQSPDTQGWDIRTVNAFVVAVADDVKANYNITNMYLTGHSAGARMIVTIALLNPRFRGVAQVDGALPPWYCPPDMEYCQNADAQKYLFCACAKGQYFYMLNGQNDDVVTPSEAAGAKKTLEQCGVNVTQRFMPNHGHEYPSEEDASIIGWFKILESDSSIKPIVCKSA